MLLKSGNNMDWLDKINITILAGLVAVTLGMLVQHGLAARQQGGAAVSSGTSIQKAYREQVARDARLYRDVRHLREQGETRQAMARLKAIMKAHPGNPYSFVAMARLDLADGRLTGAIANFRKAVDARPEYVDKKTPFYIGKEIEAVVTEALAKLPREKKLKPDDKSIVVALQNVYYLQRRLAGGCE